MCKESSYRVGSHHEDCGCGHHGHHGISEHQQGCCCHPGYGMRRFPAREELITEMEGYLKQLQAEVKGIEENLAELKKTRA